MKLVELYQYLYLAKSLNPAESKIVQDYFVYRQYNYKEVLISILEEIGADAVKQVLFPDLEPVHGVKASKEYYTSKFEKISNEFNNALSIDYLDSFITLSQLIKIENDNLKNFDYRRTYLLLMCFASSLDIVCTLKTIDGFVEKLSSSLYNVMDLTWKLPVKSSYHLEAWQVIIKQENSVEAIKAFLIADHIEKVLNKVPNNFTDIKTALDTIVSHHEWNIEALQAIFCHNDDILWQKHFVNSINKNNLAILASNVDNLATILRLIKDEVLQFELISKIDTKLLQSNIKNNYECNNLINSLAPANLPQFITNILSYDTILKHLNCISEISCFVAVLPKCINRYEFLKALIGTEVTSKIIISFQITHLIAAIEMNYHLDYLTEMIGKDFLTKHITSNYCLIDLIKELSPTDRIKFITAFFTPEKLLTFKKENDWPKLKSLLSRDDKITLNQYLYSPEDFKAKGILKKIKQYFKSNQWENDGNYYSTTISDKCVTVPTRLQLHHSVLSHLRQTNPSENLNKLIEDARQYNQSWGLFFSRAVYNPSNVDTQLDKYFSYFKDEESLTKKFNPQA